MQSNTLLIHKTIFVQRIVFMNTSLNKTYAQQKVNAKVKIKYLYMILLHYKLNVIVNVMNNKVTYNQINIVLLPVQVKDSILMITQIRYAHPTAKKDKNMLLELIVAIKCKNA